MRKVNKYPSKVFRVKKTKMLLGDLGNFRKKIFKNSIQRGAAKQKRSVQRGSTCPTNVRVLRPNRDLKREKLNKSEGIAKQGKENGAHNVSKKKRGEIHMELVIERK